MQTFEYDGKLWYRGYEDEKFISCFTVKEDEKGYAIESMSLLKDTKVDVRDRLMCVQHELDDGVGV